MSSPAKRARTDAEAGEARVAIAFDIDGVFKYGREWSKDGLRALQKVTEAKMPFVFVTNGGGGLTEASYAESMSSKIRAASSLPEKERTDVIIDENRMVLSYTPWQSQLAPSLAEGAVLIIGDPKEKVLQVAHNYGIKYAVHYSDYAVKHYNINPFRGAREGGHSHTAVATTAVSNAEGAKRTACEGADELPFEAVLVMCDPYEWYEAVQVGVDVLCSPTPLTVEFDVTVPPMPCHFSNPDVLWKSEHPFPRFGQGAFKIALKALYMERMRFLRIPQETIDERIAAIRQWGKPTDATFRFVEQRLRELAPMPHATTERFYMVGDNPTSDIEGTRRSNIVHKSTSTSWDGVLVRTGVYKSGDETNGATVVVDGIGDAVDWIIEREKGLRAAMGGGS